MGAPLVSSAGALVRVLYVSAGADRKGGAETVLEEMLRNPLVTPILAVPGEGELAVRARARGIAVHLFDLGAVGTVWRPARAVDLARAGRVSLEPCGRGAAVCQPGARPGSAGIEVVDHVSALASEIERSGNNLADGEASVG